MTGQPTDADPADGLTPERLVGVMRVFSESLERHLIALRSTVIATDDPFQKALFRILEKRRRLL